MTSLVLQTKQILERHVIRAGRAYTVSDLKLLGNETHPFVLPTSRDPLRLRVKESDKSKNISVGKRSNNCFNINNDKM